MILTLETLKRIVNVAGISSSFELKISDGLLKFNTFNNSRNALIEGIMKVDQSNPMVLKIEKTMFEKYLKNFKTKEIEITSNNDIIVLQDKKLKIIIPQLADKAITDTKELPNPTWGIDHTISIQPMEIQHILDIANNLDFSKIKMVCENGKIKMHLRKSVVYETDITIENKKDFNIIFNKGSFDSSIGKATSIITLSIPDMEKDLPPVGVEYYCGDIKIRGYIMVEGVDE